MKRLALLALLLFATSAHATVNEVTARNDYISTGGITTFAYTFKILEKTQITVLVDGILRTVDTNYSVSGLGDSAGGTVTIFVAPATGAHVSLIRDQPIQQISIYNSNEAFPATRVMTDLDKNIMVDQMQEEELRRALKFGQESFVHDVVVDDPIGSSCLAWNGLGTRVVNVTCGTGGGGGGGNVPPIATGNVVFGGPATELSQDLTGHFRYDNAAKSLIVGTLPTGPLAPGNVFIGLAAPSNSTGMQNLMVQTQQGTSPGIGLVTLGDDRVGISSWNFRGTGATNPIYGANFGVVFSTPGVANGLEIDVQNNSGSANQGQALWLNGSGTTGRANAILIDTQDGSKWDRGILFKEGFVAGGATGSISGMGIHFEQSQDADFIVIQPRLGTLGNVAFKITDPDFTVNRLELLNDGTVRGTGGLTTAAFPVFSFVDDVDSGMYQEAPNVLGWSVAGLRRLTLGTALNVWNSGAGANQGGNINLFDNTAAHSVGFLAADTINNTFRIRLPAIWGTAGQCVVTDGNTPIETWSYVDCAGGSGAGTVTTSGSPTTGGLALFSGATEITSGNLSGDVTTTNTLVTTMKNTGTAGTYGQVTTDAQGRVSAGTVIADVAHGGTGVATFAANGVLYGNAATSVLVTAEGAANTVLTANAGAPVFSATPTVSSITTTARGGVVIGPYGGSAGNVGELRLMELSGSEYVALVAPDAVTTSRKIILPAAPGSAGTCLSTDGASPIETLSYAACSSGGTGLTSLGGLVGSTQTFGNDTNILMNSSGTAHTLTWTGTLAPVRGGTGQNTSGSTGVPSINAGVWTVSAQLPKSLGGTGGTGGANTQIAYWTATTLTSNAAFLWTIGAGLTLTGSANANTTITDIPGDRFTVAGFTPVQNATRWNLSQGTSGTPQAMKGGVLSIWQTQDYIGLTNPGGANSCQNFGDGNCAAAFQVSAKNTATSEFQVTAGQFLAETNSTSATGGANKDALAVGGYAVLNTINHGTATGGYFEARRQHNTTGFIVAVEARNTNVEGDCAYPHVVAGQSNCIGVGASYGDAELGLKGGVGFQAYTASSVAKWQVGHSCTANGVSDFCLDDQSSGSSAGVRIGGTKSVDIELNGTASIGVNLLDLSTTVAMRMPANVKLEWASPGAAALLYQSGNPTTKVMSMGGDLHLGNPSTGSSLRLYNVSTTDYATIQASLQALTISTTIAGVLSPRIEINNQGQFFFTPTPTVGTFGLAANGTRKVEFQLFSDNNANVVGFIAPATVTGGSHIWALPSTAGAAGSVLTNDGSNTLSWGNSGNTSLATSTLAGLPAPSGAAGPIRILTDNVRGLAIDTHNTSPAVDQWVPLNRPCNVRLWGAKSDGTTNDDTAILAAIAAGCGSLFLPKNTFWSPSTTIASGLRIIGEDLNTVVIGGFPLMGANTVLENVKGCTSGSNCSTAGGNAVNFYTFIANKSATLTNQVGGANHEFIQVSKSGPINSTDHAGIAVTHIGSASSGAIGATGSGDNFYASVYSNQYADAMYRGDMFAAGCGADFGQSNLGCGTVFSANLMTDSGATGTEKAAALSIGDQRASGSSNGTIFYQTVTRSDANPVIAFRQGTSSYSGDFISLAGAFGGGTYTGNFINAYNGESEKFRVASTGDVFVRSLQGFSGSKVAGACTFTITGGIITNVTGC